MTGNPLLIIGADRKVFALGVSESFTVPETVDVVSPTSQYQPSGVAGTFDTKRGVAGGQTLFAMSDAAGSAKAAAFEYGLKPGDVVALSAVAANVVTVSVNGVVVHRITGVTTTAWLIGVYG